MIDEFNIEKIRNLLKKVEMNILIIEDNKSNQQAMEQVFGEAFPNSTHPYSFEGFGVDDHTIEDLITNGNYDLFVLDSSLKNWEPHPVFEQYGPNMIPFIKEKNPKAIIISVSLEPHNNRAAISKGADFSVIKSSLVDFLHEVEKIRSNS